jgi:hypothetical protein
MPFKSEAQRRYMYRNLPEIAARWEKETPSGAKLPTRVNPKKPRTALRTRRLRGKIG